MLDFRELIGDHSGDNMAEVVWATLHEYGLTNRVRSAVPKSSSFQNYQLLSS